MKERLWEGGNATCGREGGGGDRRGGGWSSEYVR